MYGAGASTGGLLVKNPLDNAGDVRSIPGLGGFPGEGYGHLLKYSCLENPLDRGAYSPWGYKESDTNEWLHFHPHLATKEQHVCN